MHAADQAQAELTGVSVAALDNKLEDLENGLKVPSRVANWLDPPFLLCSKGFKPVPIIGGKTLNFAPLLLKLGEGSEG
jgi:hypothetical protein